MNLKQRFPHTYVKLIKSDEKQEYADIYLMLNYSTCFRRLLRPSSGVNKTVTASSGTDNKIWATNFLQRNQISRPITGLEWPRGVQEVKIPRIHDNGTGWW